MTISTFRHLRVHWCSPLYHILRTLLHSSHRHQSATQGHIHTIHWIKSLSTSQQPSTCFRNKLPSSNPLQIQSRCVFKTSNHRNTLWSTLLANSLSIPALLRTSSFLTLSIRVTYTKLLKHFMSGTFNLLLSALPMLFVWKYLVHAPLHPLPFLNSTTASGSC